MAKTNQKPLADHEVSRTLTECLVECVDDARQLLTDFGQRPYRVFLVWIAWTADEDADGMLQEDELDLDSLEPDPDIVDPGTRFPVLLAEVGVGRPILVAEVELLPTPRKTGSEGLDQDAVGSTERGTLTVDQISMRLAEDDLKGLVFPFRDQTRPEALKDGIEFFWEIREHRPPGFVVPGYEGCEDPTNRRPPRRRYHVQGVPERQAGAFQWTVALIRADGERGREGEVEIIDGNPPEAPDFRRVRRSADPLLEEEDF